MNISLVQLLHFRVTSQGIYWRITNISLGVCNALIVGSHPYTLFYKMMGHIEKFCDSALTPESMSVFSE